jgi:hypothetical protein
MEREDGEEEDFVPVVMHNALFVVCIAWSFGS